MRSGVRYVRHSPALRAILLRAFLFTGFASAVWALLAVVARQDLHAGAMAYGILNGCLGAGAVIGASLLPRLRRRLPAEWMLAGAGAIFNGTLATLAPTPSLPLIVFWLVAAGCAWTTTTSTLNIAVQLSVPDWVQARTLGIYQVVFAGGMAGGSAKNAQTGHNSNPGHHPSAGGRGTGARELGNGRCRGRGIGQRRSS